MALKLSRALEVRRERATQLLGSMRRRRLQRPEARLRVLTSRRSSWRESIPAVGQIGEEAAIRCHDRQDACRRSQIR
jgi:hypothetical protein